MVAFLSYICSFKINFELLSCISNPYTKHSKLAAQKQIKTANMQNLCSHFKCCWFCSLALVILLAVTIEAVGLIVFFFFLINICQALIRKWHRKRNHVVFKSTYFSIITGMHSKSKRNMWKAARRVSCLLTRIQVDRHFFPHNLRASTLKVTERVRESESEREE